MAHTNQTPNYELSEFIGSDKPAWLVDYNGDMEKIDLGLKAAKDVADAAKAEADQGATDIAAVSLTANAADAKASGAISDLSDVYDSTSTYNVGDFVIYNNILYRCITAITVPESFDGTHWARTTVEEIITQINSDLTGAFPEMYSYDNAGVYNSACSFNVSSKPYDRYALVFPRYSAHNGFLYKYGLGTVAANTTQGIFAVRNNDGSRVDDHAIDVFVLLFKKTS